jgi:hypothetical protein
MPDESRSVNSFFLKAYNMMNGLQASMVTFGSMNTTHCTPSKILLLTIALENEIFMCVVLRRSILMSRPRSILMSFEFQFDDMNSKTCYKTRCRVQEKKQTQRIIAAVGIITSKANVSFAHTHTMGGGRSPTSFKRSHLGGGG